MPRTLLLSSAPWTDLPLEDLARKAAEFGYQGLELACWGDHFEVQRALAESAYSQEKLELLNRLDLTVPVLCNRRVGQAVSDRIDTRHQAILPDYVWGDGEPEGVSQRAAEEMMATVRAAQQLGASVVTGLCGSALWPSVAGFPEPTQSYIEAGLRDFAHQWNPILDVCAETGIQFAVEVGAGQIAFDFYSAERVLGILGGRHDFGFCVDPSRLLWQGIDPAEFVRAFGAHVLHVHIRDGSIHLNGRSGLLNSYLPENDHRRGYSARAPGRGGVDWEGFMRALNAVGYEGPLSVEWDDAGINRDFGAEEACRFVQRLDFEPAERQRGLDAFQDG